MKLKSETLRRIGKVLFVLYIVFIVWFLVFSEWYGRTGVMSDYHYNIELFREIKRFWTYRRQLGWFAVFTNLFGNVLIFVPFGFFLPMASKYRSFISAICYSFSLSAAVECFQLLSKVGSLDVDDLLLNTLGGALGYLIFMTCAAVRRRIYGVKGNKDRVR